jgi:hypothetical protein
MSTREWLRDIGSDVVQGTHLALMRGVDLSALRAGPSHYIGLLLLSYASWLAGGMLREGLPGYLNLTALTVALAQIPLVLLVCFLAAVVLRAPSHAMAFAVLVTATDPIFEVASVLIHHLAGFEETVDFAPYLNQLFLAWAAVTLIRAVIVVGGWQGWRSVAAMAYFISLLLLFAFVFPRSELWMSATQDARGEAQGLARETVFHRQGELLVEQLVELAPERPGVEDVYFLGVAPYAYQDTFINEQRVARGLMEQRFDAAGRALTLANHESTLEALPLATVTNLRASLAYLGETMNIEEDVVVLAISTHGTENHELAFQMPPLALAQLNPTLLARMLADAGIKWKVIVVSACYAGGFIEPLKDENTLIITASDATNTSFGCEPGSQMTWFGDAFFDKALRATRSFTGAFAMARAAVAEREAKEGFKPSNPQMHLGTAMKAKLESIERRLNASTPDAPPIQAMLR